MREPIYLLSFVLSFRSNPVRETDYHKLESLAKQFCKTIWRIASIAHSNSHFETNFGVCSALGAANPKIGFLKDSRKLPFKKPISIMRIAVSPNWR